ncbi:DUF2059 domain-containing protein [uncultured Acinetobacter sp.]|uniref:DUF2059 domain-containing protein n=1 Tax=uncultured Acinetobacter sp. TaxID=165433 RepID=UPI0025E20DB0|nr:DUF2059 domain-containing protein [uncultured Acinetobacter sp.]
MKTIKYLICGLICCSANLSFAAPATTQDVDKLISVMNLNQLMQDTLKQLRPQLDQQAYVIVQSVVKHESLSPQEQVIANQLADKLYTQSQKMLAWNKLKPVYSKIYGDVFSAEEVKAQIDFYSSSVGQSILQKTPLVAQETMKIMNDQLSSVMQTSQQDFEDIAKQLNELKKKAN